jgi:hypothetical protein
MVTTFTAQHRRQNTQAFCGDRFNMWGDREVTWLDGRVMSEKELRGG